MVGEVIGSYRVLERIGQGGMGTVYLAEHLLIGRKAALKVLVSEFSCKEAIVDRFFNEARAATAVRHPGIVEIYDFGHHVDGSAYIVMEYLEGEGLDHRIRRLGTMSAAQALPIVRHVASALAAAHDRNIIHRDLKPDNIFIVPDPDITGGERTKILDFGIAKLTGDAKSGVFKTHTGALLGTPAYMSPEQCKGAGGVDSRTDLYALGCILFRLMCGRPPFVAAGGGEVLAQHIYAQPPSPRSLVPSIPRDVEALILRLLAKEPAQRPASAREVAAAVDVLLQSRDAASSQQIASYQPAMDGEVRGPIASPGTPTVEQTTLRTGAGAVAGFPVESGSSGRRGIVLGASVGAVAVIGVALAVVWGDAPASEAPPRAASVAKGLEALQVDAPVVTAEPDASLDGDPDAADDWFAVIVESIPSGAAVYRDESRVGETPHVARVDRTRGETTLVLEHPGYQSKTVTLSDSVGKGEPVRVVLERVEVREEKVESRPPQPARKQAPVGKERQPEHQKTKPAHRQEALEQGAPLDW